MEQKIELKEGKITNKDLAEWFGVKPKTLSQNKENKLKELKYFAEFYEERGKIVITKVLNPIYNKQVSKNYEIIKDSFTEEWAPNGLDTCNSVSNKIYGKHKNELTVTEKTTYIYTLKSRDELYGKPFNAGGTLGNCKYLWCKVVETEDHEVVLTEFTPEEKLIKDKLMKKYFSTEVEKEVMVAEMVSNGEITKEEGYDLLCEMKHLNRSGFVAFKKELEQALNCSIVKGTKLINRLPEGGLEWE